MIDVRSLSFHAGYACRHAGACCASGWPIPVETDRLADLQSAMAGGRLQPARGGARSAIEHPPDAPIDTPAVLGRHESQCAFLEQAPRPGGGRCRVQHALGHAALPLACRQFPRVTVRDPRGWSVTLSHYCPTAAALLDGEPAGAATIAVNAPAFPAAGEYVGLDARQALPPLLGPAMIMDWESWWECERLAVQLLSAAGDDHASVALARLRMAVVDITAWSPPDGALVARVRDAFGRAAAARPPGGARPAGPRIDAVFQAIPADVRPARFAEATGTTAHATRRFLAAHAFANWTAHQGSGLVVWLRSIEAAAALVGAGAGVRQADLLLRHLVETETLARLLSAS